MRRKQQLSRAQTRARTLLHTLLVAALGLLAMLTAPVQAQTASQQSVSATVTSTRTRVYENEIFSMTLNIVAVGVGLGAINYTPGPETSFLEYGDFKELADKETMRSGIVTRVRRFRCAVRAIKPGAARVAPRLMVRIVTRRRTAQGSMQQETSRQVPVTPLAVTVLPVPDRGRPANWSKAIGAFGFKVSATPRDVSVGDIVTLKMEISGKGYRDGMVPPGVSPGRHFKAYDSKQVSDDGNAIVFEQVIIPQSTNAVSIPAVGFCFFNPLTGDYHTARKGPFHLVFHEKTVRETAVFRPDETMAEKPVGLAHALGRRRESIRRIVAILGAGLALALASVAVVRFIQRRWQPAIAALVAGAVVCVVSVWVTQSGFFETDSARTSCELDARLAPSEAAMPLFAIGKGTEVRVLEATRSWTRIRRGRDSGWVPTVFLAEPGADVARAPKE